VYLTFTQHTPQSTTERLAEMTQSEEACRSPSLCGDEQGHAAQYGSSNHLLKAAGSFVDWHSDPPIPGSSSQIYFVRIQAAAQKGATMCLIPHELPQRLEASSEAELEAEVGGLQRFLRAACGISPSSATPTNPLTSQTSQQPSATSQAEGQGAGLAGTSDDNAGAAKTYVAYNAAIDEADYERACTLVTLKYKEGLPEPCAQILAKVFKGHKASPAQRAEDEKNAAANIEIQIRRGELLWDGQRWLVNPQ
jgi:hypothetical protein